MAKTFPYMGRTVGSTKGLSPHPTAPRGASRSGLTVLPSTGVGAYVPEQPWGWGISRQAGLGCQGAPEGIVLQAPGEGLGPLWYCGPLPAVACLRGSCPDEKLLWVLLSPGAFCNSTRTPSHDSREPGGTRGVPWAWGSLWCGA